MFCATALNRSTTPQRLLALCLAALLLGGCVASGTQPGAAEGRDAAVDQLIETAQTRADAGDTEAALALLTAGLADHPASAPLRAEAAMLELGLERQADALQHLREAAALAGMQGDIDAALFYGELISEQLAQAPAWVEAAAQAAAAIPDTTEAADALAFWESARAEAADAFGAGRTDEALSIAEMNLGLAEESFGPEHRITIESALDLANYYFNSGDGDGAEFMLAVAQDAATQSLGAGHPLTLDISASMADVLAGQGRPEDAAAVEAAALSAARDALGSAAPRTVTLALTHARRLESLGAFVRAADLLDDECSAVEAAYGRWHVQSADCMVQLATLLGRGGDLAGSTDALLEVVEIRTDLLGAEARPTMRARLDLASLARQQGNYGAALGMLDILGSSARRQFDRDDPLVLDIEESRARALLDTGRTEDAERIALDVLNGRRDRYGDEHPATIEAMNLLGAIYLRQGNLVRAEQAWVFVVDGYRASYGDEHLSTITALANLGVVLEQQGAYDRAEPILRRAMELSETLLGEAHPQTLNTMNNLALLHESQGSFSRAEPLYKLPIAVLTSTLGSEHPRTIAIKNNLAYLYLLEGDTVQASAMFEDVYAGFDAALGAEHQDTLKSLNNLGRTYLRMGRLDDAQARLQRAHALRRSVLGPRHIDTLRSMKDLGALYFAQDKLGDAERQLRRTLALDEEVLGEQHPYTFETLNALCDVLQAAGKTDAALDTCSVGFQRRTEFLDRMLWVTSENAREGYIALHRDEFDRYLGLLSARSDERAARGVLEAGLKRKGLLLEVSSEIQQIASMGPDQSVIDMAQELREAREALAALTLSGPVDTDPAQHLERIRGLESSVEALEGQLGRASVRYREAIAEISVDDLAAALPANGTLVDFLVHVRPDGGRGLLAGVLSRTADGPARAEVIEWEDVEAVEAAIREYRDIIQDEFASDDEILEVGQRTWSLIWAPLQARTATDGPVYVVPDGLLNILPFDALVDPQGDFLIDTTDLYLLSSSRDLLPSAMPLASTGFMIIAGPDYDTEDVIGEAVLAEVRGRRAARRGASASDVVLEEAAEMAMLSGSTRGSRGARLESLRGISLTDIDSRSAAMLASLRAASSGLRGLQFSPLPGAELEGSLIARQIDAAELDNILLSQGAAEEQVLSNFEQPPRVLHVATHGFFLEPDEELRQRLLKAQRSLDTVVPPPGDNPLLRSGLAFAGINTNAPFLGEIDTSNDGVLTALEVLGLDLTGTELAVLSACETGLGEIHEGEGVYGLRRAFQEAGVKDVVTSLWEVSDAGTQALMTAMYERILAGEPPREALRSAQRDLRADPQWGYPYVWAAFMIVGR